MLPIGDDYSRPFAHRDFKTSAYEQRNGKKRVTYTGQLNRFIKGMTSYGYSYEGITIVLQGNYNCVKRMNNRGLKSVKFIIDQKDTTK